MRLKARCARQVLILILIGLAAVTLMSRPAEAGSPWYVSPDGSDANTCLLPGAACATINGALGKAAAGDTINVAAGVYTSSCAPTPCNVVIIDKDIHLSGGWDSSFVTQSGISVVDGQRARRGLIVMAGRHAVIDRFAAENGFAMGGTGIFSEDGVLTLNDCVIRNNGQTASGTMGGGIYIYGGSATLNRCIISGNAASDGGGVWVSGKSTVVISNSAVASNVADNSGGGIAVSYLSTVTLNNSTVSDNRGGIYYGGGISTEHSNIYLNNSTISGNIDRGEGGGGVFNKNSSVIARNTIIANNTTAAEGSDCAGAITSAGFNLIGNTAGCHMSPGLGDLVNTPAGLLPVVRQLGLVLLQASSPAVDAGNPAGCADQTGAPLLTDQRGGVRAGRCDIGAYEYTPVEGSPSWLYAVDDTTPQSANVLSPFPSPLRAAVLDNQYSQIISPVAVSFAAPESGSSGIFKSTGARTSVVTTDSSGVATAEIEADKLSGSYSVIATVSGASSQAKFDLRNLAWQPAGSFRKVLAPLGDYEWVDNNGLRLASAPDAADSKHVFASYVASAKRDHILWSSDGGLTWKTVKLPQPAGSTHIAVAPSFEATHTLYALADTKLYKSTDAGAHWEATPLPQMANPVLIRLSPNYLVDHSLFVGLYLPYTERGGVYRTTDDGQTWERLSTGDIGDAITDLDISPAYPEDPTLYLVDYNDGIFRSDNGGLSWTHLSDPQFSPDFRVALSPAFPEDGTLFVVANGISDSGVYRSTNRGDAWTQIKEGYFVNILAVSPRYAEDHTVIVGGDTRGLFMTEDSGDTWLPLRGFECNGIYGRRCDALLTYQNDRLQPIASTYLNLYRYRWPSINEYAFAPLVPGQTAPLTRQLVIDPGDSTGVTWDAYEDANWLTTTPLTGTLPVTLTLTVDPLKVTSNVMKTSVDMTVHWSRYQSETVSIPVVAMIVRSRAWLPTVYRH